MRVTILFLLLSSSAWGQIARAQATVSAEANGAPTTASCTFGSAVTAGNFIAIPFALQNNAQNLTVTSVADNKGNGNYSVGCALTASPDFGGGVHVPLGIYYLKNVATGGSSFTVTITMSGAADGYIGLSCNEFSGVDKVSPLENCNTGSAIGTTGYTSSSSITASASGELSITGLTTALVTPTVGSGWTLTDNVHTLGEYKVQGAAAAYTAQWTSAGSDTWVAVHAMFKAATATASVPRQRGGWIH